MAIQKNVPGKFGPNVPVAYWNVGRVEENFTEGFAVVTMHGFASSADRLAGGLPMMAFSYRISGAAYSPDMSRAKMYAFITGLPAVPDDPSTTVFVGGTDV